MGLLDWARHNPENYRMMERLNRDWDSIRIVDLKTAAFLTDNKTHWAQAEPMVARVGLFTEDLMTVNIPDLTWFCNDQGTIWPYWYERLPYKGSRWKQARKQEPLGPGPEYEKRKMLASMAKTLNKYTRERWIQHKMTSDSLLKPPFLNPARPTMR